MNSLSNKELFEISKKMNIPLKNIFTKDMIPKDLNHGYYIINLQSSNEGNGTHWTCFLKDIDDMIYYMDAFGFPAPNELPQPYIYENKQIQNINTSSCGYYCLGFIKYTNQFKDKLKGYKSFSNLFNKDTTKNEQILFSILYD